MRTATKPYRLEWVVNAPSLAEAKAQWAQVLDEAISEGCAFGRVHVEPQKDGSVTIYTDWRRADE